MINKIKTISNLEVRNNCFVFMKNGWEIGAVYFERR